MSVDTGISANDGRSFTVAHVWATNGVDFFLIAEFRKRCRSKELIKQIKKLAARYVGAPLLIEDKANGPALLDHLSESQQQRAFSITPRGSKTRRFRKHASKILEGHVRICKNSAFAANTVDEIVQFPNGKNNDRVDAMVQLFEWVEEHREEIDFSKSNLRKRGFIEVARSFNAPPSLGGPACGSDGRRGFIQLARKFDYRPSAQLQFECADGRGLGAIGKPSLYNPPFPAVRAWVTK